MIMSKCNFGLLAISKSIVTDLDLNHSLFRLGFNDTVRQLVDQTVNAGCYISIWLFARAGRDTANAFPHLF